MTDRTTLDALCAKYPTAYGRLYFECGPGWHAILDELGAVLERHGAVVGQCKEKFGGLRVYLDDTPEDADHDALSAAIDAAEKRAWVTCECCGEPGTRRNDEGWLRTLCMECGE